METVNIHVSNTLESTAQKRVEQSAVICIRNALESVKNSHTREKCFERRSMMQSKVSDENSLDVAVLTPTYLDINSVTT